MWRPLPLRRLVVHDTSMRPSFEPGDRVLVLQWFTALRPGEVVAFVEPDRLLTLALKRVAAVLADGSVEVRGDNANVSRDSRDYGPVARSLIVGRVVFRYLPGSRRGRV